MPPSTTNATAQRIPSPSSARSMWIVCFPSRRRRLDALGAEQRRGDRDQRRDREQDRLAVCARAAREARSDRADEDADRVEPVRHRHDPPTALGLEPAGVRVDADVECARRTARDEQRQREQRQRAREARQRRRRGEDGAGDGHRAAAVAVDGRPGDEEHRRDRAERNAEERDAERPLRDAGRALHVRAAPRPTRPRRARA